MKKGPLSNKEKKFIDENSELSVEDLCKELDRSKNIVSNYKKEKPETKQKATTTPTHNLFARKKDRGVVVMTETASATSDENKKNRKQKMPNRYRDIIHKIRED